MRPHRGSDAYHVLNSSLLEDDFSRLTLVDANDFDGASSRLVEITRRYEAEHDIVKPLKLCICLAEGSYSAEITEIHDVDKGYPSSPIVLELTNSSFWPQTTQHKVNLAPLSSSKPGKKSSFSWYSILRLRFPLVSMPGLLIGRAEGMGCLNSSVYGIEPRDPCTSRRMPRFSTFTAK